MSEPVSALNGAHFIGLVEVSELKPRGMITVRGNLSSASMKKAVDAATGCAVPKQREVLTSGDHAAIWMSPDELLLITPQGEAAAAVAAAEKALARSHAMVVEVSDARATFAISGTRAREVLAKLVPVDLHPDAFSQGMVRRTHCAQVPAAIWMTGEENFELVCFRSVATYVFGLLSDAAQPGGEVDLFA